jgi:hypothetical protein
MLLCTRRQTLTYFTGSFKNPSKYSCTLPSTWRFSYPQKTMKYRSVNNSFFSRTFTNILHGLRGIIAEQLNSLLKPFFGPLNRSLVNIQVHIPALVNIPASNIRLLFEHW